MTSLSVLPDISYLNVSNVTEMNCMIKDCTSLIKLSLNNSPEEDEKIALFHGEELLILMSFLKNSHIKNIIPNIVIRKSKAMNKKTGPYAEYDIYSGIIIVYGQILFKKDKYEQKNS